MKRATIAKSVQAGRGRVFTLLKREFKSPISLKRIPILVDLSLIALCLLLSPSGAPLFATDLTGNRTYKSNPGACPVTADIFPEVRNDQNDIAYSFPIRSVARRIGIALNPADNTGEVRVKFTWIAAEGTISYNGTIQNSGLVLDVSVPYKTVLETRKYRFVQVSFFSSGK